MRPLASTGLRVHSLCLGTNVFGSSVDPDRAFEILDAYAEGGGNFIDLADQYPFWKTGNRAGEAEQVVGRWMRSRRNRGSLVIATKVGLMPGHQGLSAPQVIAGAEASLARLKVDSIDLFYAHFDDPNTPLEETLGAFGALVQQGKVRHIAASNFSPSRLATALQVAADLGVSPFVALQSRYNLLARDGYEGELREIVANNAMAGLSYSPLAAGYLAGRYTGEVSLSRSPQAPLAMEYDGDRSRAVVATVGSIAAARNESSAAVSLAWVLAQPVITSAVASATSVRQVAELLAASQSQLTPAELEQLDSASR
jgi:aryl-alcohol dehydrogenase (NADP+)